MQVAVWDHLPPALFAPSDTSSTVDFAIFAAEECAQLLLDGAVDAALVPTLAILRDTGAFDVLPAVALSSWNFPFARLQLNSDLGNRIDTMDGANGYALETLLARIVLREHYGSDVTVKLREETVSAASSTSDAALVVGSAVHELSSSRYSMDLGREWFELANYPMVWGLFAVRAGEGSKEAIVTLRDSVIAHDERRAVRASEMEDAVVRDFLQQQVRMRLDDLAVASLTELYNYVYYYGAVADYTTITFVSLDEPADAIQSNGGDE